MQGSGALSASTLPMQQPGSAQRRTMPGQVINAWPPNSARKESLHNGPISAQDLATSIRGRPASSDDSRQCASMHATSMHSAIVLQRYSLTQMSRAARRRGDPDHLAAAEPSARESTLLCTCMP
jgi:hypothetical protein